MSTKGVARPEFPLRGFVLVVVFVVMAGLLLFWFLVGQESRRGVGGGPRTFTREELWRYRGENGSPIYLAVKGKVFDVTVGRPHYGPGAGYSSFAGRDASRAFADMCFKQECMKLAHITDDSMSKEQKEAVDHWLSFYEKEKRADGTLKYPFVGTILDDSPYDESKPWFASPIKKT